MVRTARDAAEVLVRDWPHNNGAEFCEAVKTCVDVMFGRSAPGELRTAMLRAASEAGIATFYVNH